MDTSPHPQGFEIRFEDLFGSGRSLVFPCDAMGHVNIDALSDRAQANYLYARAMVGREYSLPTVCSPAHPEPAPAH